MIKRAQSFEKKKIFPRILEYIITINQHTIYENSEFQLFELTRYKIMWTYHFSKRFREKYQVHQMRFVVLVFWLYLFASDIYVWNMELIIYSM